MKGILKYLVEVDLKSVRKITEGKTTFLALDKEGDTYQNMPFDGILVASPQGSKIKIGEQVFMNHQAIDTLIKINDKPYYYIDESLIVAYGENKQAFNCVILEPKTEKIESEYLTVIQDDLPDTVKGIVLSSDIEGINKGDEIEYENNVDWEFLLNHKKHYYIKWTENIVKCNGELINNYVEVELMPQYKIRNGIRVPEVDNRRKVHSGEYKGELVYLDRSSTVVNNKYIKSSAICGVD